MSTAPSPNPFRDVLNRALRDDAWLAFRERTGALFDGHPYAHLSDVEVASAFKFGESAEHDALYCELHLRRLSPWMIVEGPEPLEVAP